MTLFGNRVVGDVVNQIREGSNPVTGVLRKGEYGWTQIHTQGECHVKLKAAIRVTFLQVRENQTIPANYQKVGYIQYIQ